MIDAMLLTAAVLLRVCTVPDSVAAAVADDWRWFRSALSENLRVDHGPIAYRDLIPCPRELVPSGSVVWVPCIHD